MVGNEFSAGVTKAADIKAWSKCAHVPGKLNAGETRTIGCSEVHRGRYLSIFFDHPGILTLCEVEIFASKILSDHFNLKYLRRNGKNKV